MTADTFLPEEKPEIADGAGDIVDWQEADSVADPLRGLLSAKGRGAAYRRSEGPLTLLSAVASAPRWTISGRHPEGKNREEDCPGPGDYNVAKAEAATHGERSCGKFPKAGLGGDNTWSAITGESPGPCYHTADAQRPKVVGGTIGRDSSNSDVRTKFKASIPGPGAYPLRYSSLSDKGVAIGDPPKRPRSRPSSAPVGGRRSEGPENFLCCWEIEELKEAALKAASTQEARGRRSQSQTSVSSNSTSSKCKGGIAKGSIPGVSFGTSRRPPINRPSSNPNAKQFMPPSTLRSQAASCACGSVPPEFGRFEVRPDPFTYDTSHAKKTPRRGGSFTRAARKFSTTAGTQSGDLGPGSYSVPNLGPGLKRSASLREPMSSTAKRMESTARDSDTEPGPGSYAPGFRECTGTGPKPCTFAKAKKDVAGSGDHVVAHSEAAKRRAAIIRATFQAPKASARPPGPACFSSRGVRLPSRREGRASPKKGICPHGPGPGAFNLRNMSTGANNACVFPTGPRMAPTEAVDDGPGPGFYDTSRARGLSTKGAKIAPVPTGARCNSEKDDGPSPGDYTVYSSLPQPEPEIHEQT
eukprot:TRINITY_DN65339_c0_g1_i1.p1 TRINITY_DN65339_c0_g1~~TRINITY_DN65339_c0_g1_i1.p1  ORF type:complete len:584 (+),score=92.19 TRINITY_DN65339_c0_g1_i1:81-1832(+)